MILSTERQRRWPSYVISAAVLIVVAYVFHGMGVQDAEPVIPKVIVAQMPVVAPPSVNAEPELPPMNQPVKVQEAKTLTLPAVVPVPEATVPPEQEVPPETPAVTAYLKNSPLCNTMREQGGAAGAIQRIVAYQGTISAATMNGFYRLEDRCARAAALP